MFKSAADKKCLHEYIRQNCLDDLPVPNVIHLLWYGKGEHQFDIQNAIGLYSILTVSKPCLLILHGNVEHTGPLWNTMLPLAKNVVRVHKEPTTHIKGRKIRNVQNMADIGRIELLIEYGGIYLDSDMIITRKLDLFRSVQFAANKEGGDGSLSNGILIAVPGQELLKIWLDSWDTYDGVSWTSHSTWGITKLARKYPHLISYLGPVFIKFGYHEQWTQLYKKTCSLHDAYAGHIYDTAFPRATDVITIKKMNSTFGRMARFVLFGDPKLCP